MKRKISRVALVLFCFVLTACSSAPKTGYVYDRKFHPAYYYTTMECMSRDSKGNCTFNLPVQHYQPDSYELCLEADAPGSDGKKDRGCRDATLNEYEQYQIGMHYPDAR